MVNFAKLLREKRIEKGISRKELAITAGVTERAICYWERAERSMSIENADKVFSALGVEVVIGKSRGYEKNIRNV